MLRLVRHVVLRIGSRSVGLRVGVDAEHRVVAGLARPHPVVGLAAELAHRLRDSKHKAQVAEGAVCRSVILVALVERLNLKVERRVLLVQLLNHLVLHLVEQLLALLVVHLVEAALGEHLCDVLLVDHEAHEHILVRQLLLECLRIEAVEHVVVLHGRVRTDSLEATVVVGEDESVGRHYDARAVTREVDNGVLDGVLALVELVVRRSEAIALHLLVNRLRQVVERPHAFVGMSGSR